MAKFNPFRPNSIVTPGMFAGRGRELLLLDKFLHQTKNGNPQHFLIVGERGIGKSSLLLYLQQVARGEWKFEDASFDFLTVSVELEPTFEYADILRKIGGSLKTQMAKEKPLKDVAAKTWEFVSKLEVAGFKYSGGKSHPAQFELLDQFADALKDSVDALGLEKDGILILIDEADKPPPKAHLGEFAKLVTERLTRLGCDRVCLGMAGLSQVIRKLRDSHESAPRVFEVVRLEPLLQDERMDVIRKGLDAANRRNEQETSITLEAERRIADFSEGYPHFIQQFAYSAFNDDDDDVIDESDVLGGAFGEHGAFEQLGQKYFHDLYFAQVGSDEYRAVLHAMATRADSWIPKKDIRELAKIKETTLTNALSALKKRNIILAKEGQQGMYRLPTKSFAVWIRAYTEAAAAAATLPGNGAHEGPPQEGKVIT